MYRLFLIQIIFVISTFASQVMALSTGLRWPVKCTPGVNCQLGLPDIENTNQTSLCTKPGVPGHEGTDIGARPGTEVYAAADGVVRWAFDGAADRCSTKDINHPDCQKPKTEAKAGQSDGYRRCTPAEECDDKSMGCFWCFYGGNVIVLRHSTTPGVSGTRYDHLKKGSLLVKPGDIVKKGQLIARSGDSGNTSGPHLHFEIWGEKTYQPLDPWRGPCSSKTASTLWESDTPWIKK